MAAAIKNILIGIFVLTALGITIFMLLFLHPSVGDNAKTLRVRFTDVDKVNVGTRVTFAGRPVGEVVSITEIPSARTSRLSVNGDVYVYELVLKVDSGVDVFNTDSISLRTSGLLGERNVEINPRPLLPGEKLQKVEDEILYAAQTTSVEDTMKQFSDLSQKFDQILDDFHQVMNDLKKEDIVKKIGQASQNILDITDSLNQPEKLRKTVDNAFTFSERINELSQRAERSWTKVDRTLDEFQRTATNAVSFSSKADQIMNHTLQGQGTIGQLFVGDDLYLRLKSILHKGEVLMNDVNSYGLTFHLDKRWQRLQGRRLKLLEKLSSPTEFAHYFNNQMDEISSSLSRVTMVLNESDCYPTSLIYNPDFTKRFTELLKRIENVEETLKIYNEQVINQEECSR